MATLSITERLRRRIRKQNAQLKTDAFIEAGMGLAVSVGTYGLVFVLAWALGCSWTSTTLFSAMGIGLAVSGVVFLVAGWSAWRRVDPMAEIVLPPPKHPTVQWMESALASLGGGSTVNPRLAVASIAMLFLSGPESLLDAYASWRRRLQEDDNTLKHAASLLKRCRKGATAADIRDPQSAMLLKRLLLIRVASAGETPRLELTDLGRRLIDKSAGPRKASSKS